MNDTPKYIYKKQFEIINAKPLKERLNRLFEMTELSRTIIENRLKLKNPNLSNVELQIELFKIFYHTDFDKNTLKLIAESMRESNSV